MWNILILEGYTDTTKSIGEIIQKLKKGKNAFCTKIMMRAERKSLNDTMIS